MKKYQLTAPIFIILISIAYTCSASAECSSRLLELADNAVYAPWRDIYKKETKKQRSYNQGCVFCVLPEEEQGHNFILARYEHCFVLMNIYPYTKGHLLIIPYQHTASISSLCPEARLEIMNVIAFCLDTLKEVLQCEGFNVGMNIGEAAKASVPDHLHIHVMPRYKVDAGFAHLIGGTKVVAWDLEELYCLLLPVFQ
jgi:ATP adenylyltransferase